MDIDKLKSNILSVRERIARASSAAGADVTVVAATKTVSPQMINAAVELGITDVGENRVQEYLNKKDAVLTVKWHFIGTLQTNKVKYLVGSVALIQSVNSVKLAYEIDRIAAARDIVQDVLIELDAAGDPCKTGAPIESADELIAAVSSLRHVRVRGIMSVPPKNADGTVYKRLRDIYERYNTVSPCFDILSVGMSGDFERAVGFGCNMVRLGTAIFGSRIA